MKKKIATREPSLQEIQKRFEVWRGTRRKRTAIPSELWEAAVRLSNSHTTNEIARTLRLNYSTLTERIESQQHRQEIRTIPEPAFIELPSMPPPRLAECLIEMENLHGERITMHFKGDASLDLQELSKTFWGRRP